MLHLFEEKRNKKGLIRPFLNKIVGVGDFFSIKYCKKLGFLQLLQASDLSLTQKTALESIIIKDRTNLKNENLVRAVSENILNLSICCCFRGILHKKQNKGKLLSKKSSRNFLK
jgi:ribosomal protein S13